MSKDRFTEITSNQHWIQAWSSDYGPLDQRSYINHTSTHPIEKDLLNGKKRSDLALRKKPQELSKEEQISKQQAFNSV